MRGISVHRIHKGEALFSLLVIKKLRTNVSISLTSRYHPLLSYGNSPQ